MLLGAELLNHFLSSVYVWRRVKFTWRRPTQLWLRPHWRRTQGSDLEIIFLRGQMRD
jgi:hypothetical protein